jgi:TolB-like protein/DNA-binding SARP family transcriptional activator
VSKFKLALFGGFELSGDSTGLVEISSKRARGLLAYLAMHPGENLSREVLATLLWSRSDDEHARQSLRQAIADLRRAGLAEENGTLIIAADSLTSATGGIATDVEEFARLAAADSVESLKSALRMATGTFLKGLTLNEPVFEEWVAEESRALAATLLATMDKLVSLYEAEGEYDAALETARGILKLDSLQEAAHRAIMRCLDRLGRRAEAIQQYKICSEILKMELGVEPSDATILLYREIGNNSGKAQARGVDTGAGSRSLDENPTPTKPARPRRFVAVGALLLSIAIIGTIMFVEPRYSRQFLAQGSADALSIAIPSGPAIAVLPFDNMSEDLDQEYFADGITEDIITRLAAFRELKVIGRNSSFQFKGEAVDVREVGRKLGADYVLEGSIRRDIGSIRVSAQLLDTHEGVHVWTETYDRDLSASSIFAIQDEITERVAASLGGAVGAISASRIRRLQNGSTEDLQSYECVLLAQQYGSLITAESHLTARTCLIDVITREPNYVEALAWLGLMYQEEIWSGFNPRDTGPAPLDATFEVLNRAVQLDPSYQLARKALAIAYFYGGDAEQFRDEARKAVSLNPNDASTIGEMAMWVGYSGDWERSKALSERLRNLVAEVPEWHNWTEFNIHYRDKDYAAAATSARASLEMGHWAGPWYLGLAYAAMGEPDKAMEALAKARALEPNLTTDVVQEMVDVLFLDDVHIALLMDGHAGLLEIERTHGDL